MGGADVHLSAEEIAAIEAIAREAEKIEGGRYAAEHLADTFGDTPEEK